MSHKKPKVDPGSPFAKLAEMKEKLAADEAKAKAAKAAGKAPAPKAAASSPKQKPRPAAVVSEEDALAFHRLVSGVTPLDAGSRRVPKTQQALDAAGAASQAAAREAARAQIADEAQAVHDHLRALVEGGARFETSDDGHRVEGRRVDTPSEDLRKLRRGLYPIDARVDLHGLHAGDAREQVEAFLREKRARGERCVLIVHGKGSHSPSGQGILRGEIAAWLAQGRASDHVAAFATAENEDGGAGAVYVLLRR